MITPEEIETVSDKKILAAHKTAVNLVHRYSKMGKWTINADARFRARVYLRQIFREACKRGLLQ